MLFSKNLEPCCAYCQRGTPFRDEQVLCIKKGIMPKLHGCEKFRYDPLKRIPSRPAIPDFSRLTAEDFTL